MKRALHCQPLPWSLVAALVIFTGGCGDDDNGIEDLNGVGEELSDAEILQVAITANTGEIEQAELALDRAESAAVQAYAQRMIDEHSEARTAEQNLAEVLELEPEDSELSDELEDEAEDVVDDLEDADDERFDGRYIASQVIMHEMVLDVLDRRLIPDADAQSLRDHLEELRTTVADHLRLARDLRGDAGVDAGMPTDDAGTMTDAGS